MVVTNGADSKGIFKRSLSNGESRGVADERTDIITVDASSLEIKREGDVPPRFVSGPKLAARETRERPL